MPTLFLIVAAAAWPAAASATWAGSPGLITWTTGQINMLEPDGSGLEALATDTAALPRDIAWSPDGARLAFTTGTTLETVGADGSGERTIVRQPQNGLKLMTDPAFSPDGSRISFALHQRVHDRFIRKTYIVRADGTHLRKLHGGHDAVWSPDGRLIAYAANGGNIVVSRPDGTRRRVVVDHDRGPSFQLDFAPSGQRLAYYHIQLGDNHSYDMYPIDLATGRRTRVSVFDEAPIGLVWTHDGRRLAYMHQGSTNDPMAIRSRRPDGSGIRTEVELPDTPGPVTEDLSWQSR